MVNVNSKPTAILANLTAAICQGQDISLHLTPIASGTWTMTLSDGTSIYGNTGASVDVTPFKPNNSLVYTIASISDQYCTANSTDLVGTGTATITVNPLPVVTITDPSAICAPGTIDLTVSSITAGSTSSITYSYFTDASATTTLATPAAISATGTYYIKGTTAASCSDIDEVEVNINPIPAKPVLTSNSPICEGQDINLSTANVTGGVFSWTGVNSFSSADQNPSIATATNAATGDYIATVTVDGCVSEVSDPLAIVVNVKPTIVATASKTTICVGETITLTATGAGTNGSYTWDDGNTSDLISLSTSNSKTYSVTGTDANGCSNSSAVSVTVYPNPNFTLNSLAVCTGNPSSIAVTPLTGVVADYNYTWTVPTGATVPGSVPSFTTTVPGVYSGKIINKNTACESATKNTTVTFYPLPNAAAIVASDNKVMEGGSLNLTAAATGGTGAYA